MMEEKNDMDKNIDDVMLPGFRFHPTDEELVGFYLKRKIQQQSLPIELIKQVDIYKFDPWDLPKLATTGEKEWYFYCPRDRKYRNSARPNRVTGAGFWKATGTDRPIYSSDSTKCIGLKKSLVFYRGRAAKGIKTDWMMHEFRLPSIAEPSPPPPPKKLLDRSLPPNDAWAICRIFKKTNSMAQRALNHSWLTQISETTASDILNQGAANCAQFSSENISCTTEIGSVFQICSNNDLHQQQLQQQQQQASSSNFSPLDIPSYKPISPAIENPSLYSAPEENHHLQNHFLFSPLEIPGPNKCNTVEASDDCIILNPASQSIEFQGSEDHHHQFNGFSISLQQEAENGHNDGTSELRKNTNPSDINQWGNMRNIGYPFSLPTSLPWDSPPCPSEMSSTTTYSTDKCYT